MRLPVSRMDLIRRIVQGRIFRIVFSSENIYALLLSLVIILLVILTADKAPLWIYQGF